MSYQSTLRDYIKNLPAKTHYMKEAHYTEDASPKDNIAYSLLTLRDHASNPIRLKGP